MQLLPALLLMAAAAEAHYTFPRLIVNGKLTQQKDWVDVRKTKNADTKTGISSVTSPDMRCYGGTAADQVTTINAGDTVAFLSTQQINHPGPQSYYMAKVPSSAKVESWDGSGNVWFKVFTTTPTVGTDKVMKWAQPPEGKGDVRYPTYSFTMPKNIPNGDYLLRAEQIALHQAAQSGGAQIYIACAQVRVTGGGTGSPGPLVAFPGAYGQSDPGILVNINAPETKDYVPPGPAVWTG